VQLGTDGWRERYYKAKFGIDINAPEDQPFLKTLAKAYMEGIQWVLRYYYQGCCSWTWYFPFHYAPFANELVRTSKSNQIFPFLSFPFLSSPF